MLYVITNTAAHLQQKQCFSGKQKRSSVFAIYRMVLVKTRQRKQLRASETFLKMHLTSKLDRNRKLHTKLTFVLVSGLVL